MSAYPLIHSEFQYLLEAVCEDRRAIDEAIKRKGGFVCPEDNLRRAALQFLRVHGHDDHCTHPVVWAVNGAKGQCSYWLTTDYHEEPPT